MDDLDLVEKTLVEVIDFVKMTSPELWRIALQQAWAETLSTTYKLLVWLMIDVLCVLATRIYSNKVKNGEMNHDDDGWLLLLIGTVSFFSTIVAALLINDLIYLIINPEWYAIQNLIELVK